jgi:acetylornithine/succinyldiaminopimelate/putrescine aminotransferase
MVLVGKAMGNGFPVAGIALDRRLQYHPMDFRLNSTFWNNPLSCAAVVGTLAGMERIDIEKRVAHIERTFAGIEPHPKAELRLHGAACFIELDSPWSAAGVENHLVANRITAPRNDATITYVPAATITDEHLEHVVKATNRAFALLG